MEHWNIGMMEHIGDSRPTKVPLVIRPGRTPEGRHIALSDIA